MTRLAYYFLAYGALAYIKVVLFVLRHGLDIICQVSLIGILVLVTPWRGVQGKSKAVSFLCCLALFLIVAYASWAVWAL